MICQHSDLSEAVRGVSVDADCAVLVTLVLWRRLYRPLTLTPTIRISTTFYHHAAYPSVESATPGAPDESRSTTWSVTAVWPSEQLQHLQTEQHPEHSQDRKGQVEFCNSWTVHEGIIEKSLHRTYRPENTVRLEEIWFDGGKHLIL
jgi:hypothetical protein